MYCSRCGAEVSAGAAFCGGCGAPTAVGAGTPVALKRPPLITVLSVLQFIGVAIWFVCALIGAGTLAAGLGAAEGGVMTLVFVVLGALQLICGIGLLKLKPYGRTLQLVFAWIGLLAIPIGTIISILILVYMFKPGIKLLFSGKPANELTAEESAQVAAVSQSSAAVVIAVVAVLAVALVAVIGIVAAIAVPGLIGARTAGNESAAIGSLRTINSAQAAFAAGCGNGFYAATLESLAASPSGGGEGFLPRDLAADPIVRNGYTITLTAGDAVPDAPAACNGARVVSTYFVSASPETPGQTGTRFFATNQGMTLFQSPQPIRVTHVGMPEGAAPIY